MILTMNDTKIKLVKAELLWTRVCGLHCHYCAMADGRKNSRSKSFWNKGAESLRKLGCRFVAIYGAEPLLDFDKLPSLVASLTTQNVLSTVITSGVVPDFYRKLDILYDVGLRSLTMSYDIVPLDKWSKTKSDNALRGLKYFQTKGQIRDVAIVVTLTRRNFRSLPSVVSKLTDEGVWLFFDLVHPDRGQPGSKTKGKDTSLLFRKDDISALIDVLDKLEDMKKAGSLVHSSIPFIEMLKQSKGDLVLNYNWHCAKRDSFPAWVTIDCDGLVYPCDDFQMKGMGVSLDSLDSLWNDLPEFWRDRTLNSCPGCSWNTHIDAHFIKEGKLPFGGYVHEIQKI